METLLEKMYHVTQPGDYWGHDIDQIHVVVKTFKHGIAYEIDLKKYAEGALVTWFKRMAINVALPRYRVLDRVERLLGEMVKPYEIVKDDFKDIWNDISEAILADVKKHQE